MLRSFKQQRIVVVVMLVLVFVVSFTCESISIRSKTDDLQDDPQQIVASVDAVVENPILNTVIIPSIELDASATIRDGVS